MNTRLQVEHPVTEMITGIDLVEQQILVARGKKLSFGQEDLSIKGHAIELRVYAEDPKNNFLPSIGTLEKYETPTGRNIRVDDSFLEGMQIPIHYDPMIAKLITYAETRKEAIALMGEAISKYHIEGIETTLGFGHFVMNHKAFVSGKFDTHFVKKYYKPNSKNSKKNKEESKLIANIAAVLYQQACKEINIPKATNEIWYENRR
jgi:propionyl-CoA carboxylase alpha chain